MAQTGWWVAADAGGAGSVLPSRITSADNGTLTGTAAFTTIGGVPAVRTPSNSPVTVPDRDYWDPTDLTWIWKGALHSIAGSPAFLSHSQGSGVVPKWIWCWNLTGARQEIHYQTSGVTVDGGNAWTPTVDQIVCLAVTRSGQNWSLYRAVGNAALVADGTDITSQAFTASSGLLRIGHGGEVTFDTDAYTIFVRMYDSALVLSDINVAADPNQPFSSVARGMARRRRRRLGSFP